jgi:tetratricopeptide (TPR) repeat protein
MVVLASHAMDKELTPFQSKALEVLENKRFWILITVAAAIILGIGVSRYFMEESQNNKERLAAEKLFLVEKMEGEGVASTNRLFSQEYVKARIDWSAEKKAEMRKILEDLIKEYPTSSTAQSARLRLANLNFNDGKLEDALKNYDEIISKGSTKESDIPALTAKLGKGYTLEGMEKYSDALEIYDVLSKNEQSPVLAEALFSKARVLKSLSRDKDAEPVLKKIETDFAGTYYEEAARALKTTLTL